MCVGNESKCVGWSLLKSKSMITERYLSVSPTGGSDYKTKQEVVNAWNRLALFECVSNGKHAKELVTKREFEQDVPVCVIHDKKRKTCVINVGWD